MAEPVSQSRTMWVKKGTIVNGKAVKKGYVAQYGKAEKRVTNKVRLEVDTPKRGVKGDVVTLKKGRYVQPGGSAKKPNTGNVSPSSSSGRGGGQTAAGSVDAGKKGKKPLAAQSGYQAGGSAKKSGFGYGAMNKTGKGSKGTKASKPDMVYAAAINQWVPKQGYTAKTNPNNKGRVQGMREGRAATPGLALELAGLYGAGRLAAAGASRAIGKTAIAKTGDLAGKGAKEGIASAGKGMASSGRGAAASAPKAAAKTKPRPGQVGGVRTPKGMRADQAAAKARRQAAAAKGQATRKANAAKKTAAAKKTTTKKK